MKIKNSKKLLDFISLSEMEAWIEGDVLIKLWEYMPDILNKWVYSYNIPAWDYALCRKHKRSIKSPSRGKDGNHEKCSVIMLKNYVKKHSKDGWVDWDCLIVQLNGVKLID